MSNFVEELPCRRSSVRFRLRMVPQPSLDLVGLRASTNRAVVRAPLIRKRTSWRRARVARLRLFRSGSRPFEGTLPKGPAR